MKEPITDYTFTAFPDHKVKLSQLFGGKDELIVVHNMGKKCPYCTLWADGFNGVIEHLEDRVPFVLVTPDAPAVQREFAESRKWRFHMYSAEGTQFIEDMGFGTKEKPEPGFSVFLKENGQIFRVAKDEFGPGDKYTPVFNMFELLPKGVGKWAPKYSYNR